MTDKKSQDKQLRVLTRTLTEVLTQESTYRDECLRLKKLGLETGPDLEDQILLISGKLQNLDADGTALDGVLETAPHALYLAVLDVLVKQRRTSTVQRLLETRPGWERQKSLNAALHRLELVGVRVDRPTSHAGTVPVTGDPPESFLRRIDRAGQFLLWIFVPEIGNEATYHLLMDEVDGILSMKVEDVGARGTRRELRQLAGDRKSSIYATPTPFALRVIQQMMETSRLRRRAIPLELSGLRYALRDRNIEAGLILPETTEPAPDPTRMSDDMVVQLMVMSGAAFWKLESRDLLSVMTRVTELTSSSLVVSPDIQRDRFQEVLRSLTDDHFHSERRERLARRLEMTAVHAAASGEQGVWPMAAALADQVRDSTVPPSSITLCCQIVELSFLREVENNVPREEAASLDPEPPANPPDDAPRIILP